MHLFTYSSLSCKPGWTDHETDFIVAATVAAAAERCRDTLYERSVHKACLVSYRITSVVLHSIMISVQLPGLYNVLYNGADQQ